MRLTYIKKFTPVAISTTVGVYFRQFRYDAPPELLQTWELSDLRTVRRSAGFGMTVARVARIERTIVLKVDTGIWR